MSEIINNPSEPKQEELLVLARKRFRECMESEAENRALALDDLNFLIGDQWDQTAKAQRMEEGRPCLTMNQLPKFRDQVLGDLRQNKLQIKVLPVDSKADPATAKIMTGMIRHIENISNADHAYDTAATQQVSSGWGYFQITTDYVDDTDFDQEILIKRITNQFSVYFDPAAQEADLSDARYCFLTSWMSEAEGEAEFGSEWENAPGDSDPVWRDKEKGRRVCHYWVKEPVNKRMVGLVTTTVNEDGTVSETTETKELKPKQEPPEGMRIARERKVKSHRVRCYRMTGDKVLETYDWLGKYIPVIPVLGNEIWIENKRYLHGVIRFGKDPQKAFNMHWTNATEEVALAPKQPYLVTAKQIGTYKPMWDLANRKNWPYLAYNPDPEAPGPPARQHGPETPIAHLQLLQYAGQGMKDAIGLYDASLGKQSNETSGRAIVARQREGDTGTFIYPDNVIRAVRYCGRQLVDLIPKVYDTERIVRILGPDDTPDLVPINQPLMDASSQPVMDDNGIQQIYDLSYGKYDAIVSVGPSFATKRIEAANSMLEFIRVVPAAGPLLGDLIAKNMDWEGAEEISERLKMLVPQPQLAQPPMAAGPGAAINPNVNPFENGTVQ